MGSIDFRVVEETGYPTFLFMKECNEKGLKVQVEYTYRVNHGTVCKKNMDPLREVFDVVFESLEVSLKASAEENIYESYKGVFNYKGIPIFILCRDYNYMYITIGRGDKGLPLQ